ncbi:hypothetical protein LPJ61_003416 [Coemansia biformis]|uniref:EamA domain-containing protein n=1 Tax=Coemansia biformis TaxID=1286918 RepID=A0A9W7YAL2_9FUNG|nr:hypothetical protein LPJ61_003416 [Coemansia biformis]
MERRATEASPLVGGAGPHGELTGYVMMAVSATAFVTVSVCTKALAQVGMPTMEIVFARSVVQLGLGLLGCVWFQQSPLGPSGVRQWLVVRGGCGAAGNALFFFALSVMPLADATVVFFTGPVFSALFASWMLGEPYTALDRAASALCLLGIVLVVKPAALFPAAPMPTGPADGDAAAGTAAALVGAMSGALAYCVVRKVGSAVHFMVHVVYFGFLSLAASTAMLVLWQRPRLPQSASEWALAGAVGVAAFAGQVLLNRGLQLAPAGPATLMRNLDVVFAFVLGVALFDEIPDALSVAGAGIIVSSTVAMGIYRWRASR